MSVFIPSIPEIGAGLSLEQASVGLEPKRPSQVFGCHGSALAALLVRQSRRWNKRYCVIEPTPDKAKAMVRDLMFFEAGPGEPAAFSRVVYVPSFDLGPYDEVAPDRREVMQRASSLYRLRSDPSWRFCVVTASTVRRRVLPAEDFAAACRVLSLGEPLDRDELGRHLERIGYHRAPLVEEPGTYAVRGSLLDVYPPHAEHPARIELWGKEIERIRLFDPETQSTETEVESVAVHPARLLIWPSNDQERSRAAQRLRRICDDVDQPTTKTSALIDEVLTGQRLVGIDGLLPALTERFACPLDYLPDDVALCVEDPLDMRLAWRKAETKAAAEYEQHRVARLPSFPPHEHLLSGDAAEDAIASRTPLYAQTLVVHDDAISVESETADHIELLSLGTADLGERLRNANPDAASDPVAPFARYLGALEKEGYRTILVAHTQGQASRLSTMLEARGLAVRKNPAELIRPGLAVVGGELARGHILPADGVAYIAEEEVFGRRSRRRSSTRKTASSIDDLRTLRPGDLVVHAEHGIGRYDGLVRQAVRGAPMDFLLIIYRGGDKLYLPVYRLNQVQRYKGEGSRDTLDKLGGVSFAKTKAEVKKAARDMAHALLDLYAKRSAWSRAALEAPSDLQTAFEAAFPFEETDDQARAIDEVMADLSSERPMDRLVCGDVGFGKTEVAMRAAFRAVMAGKQVAVLVPTTVLAQQHYQSFCQRFAPYPVNVEVLSRFRTDAQNREVVFRSKTGLADIVIGTHRLLSKDVHFKQLGLLIIDEEHRFGVAHKERVRSLRTTVDTLTLTATPIPRTLQMAMGGVRDLSLISTPPAARKPVRTFLCHDEPQTLAAAIERELSREGQVFYVHNRVKDIGVVAQRVQQLAPKARIAIGHGQMKEDALEQVMFDFVSGRYDILVCTTIVESGLDISRANTIIIDRADTFGMAQLYQLRGRVGRSHQQAYAYLVVPPLAQLADDARTRVETLVRHTELGAGFAVSTMDLELRGSGDMLGADQSGNVAAVGLEMFCDLLSEAVAELQGKPRQDEIEPELTFERPGLIPEEYVPDVGERLQWYKRLAAAEHEQHVQHIAAQLIDRCGSLPSETEDLVKAMTAKALCRALAIRGLEVAGRGIVVHLAPDCAVRPAVVLALIKAYPGRVQLTEDMKIKVKLPRTEQDAAQAAIRFLHELTSYDTNPSEL